MSKDAGHCHDVTPWTHLNRVPLCLKLLCPLVHTSYSRYSSNTTLVPQISFLKPEKLEPRYSSASFTGTNSMRSRSKSSGGFSPWRSSTRTSSAEGYLPLRKKTQNITPTITKTIRRANRKNASIANTVRRLAQKARRLWTWSEVGSTEED